MLQLYCMLYTIIMLKYSHFVKLNTKKRVVGSNFKKDLQSMILNVSNVQPIFLKTWTLSISLFHQEYLQILVSAGVGNHCFKKYKIQAYHKLNTSPVLFSLFIRPIYDLENITTYADDNYLGDDYMNLSEAIKGMVEKDSNCALFLTIAPVIAASCIRRNAFLLRP